MKRIERDWRRRQGAVAVCNKIRGCAGLPYSHFAVEISRGNDDADVMVVNTKVLRNDQTSGLELLLEMPVQGPDRTQTAWR